MLDNPQDTLGLPALKYYGEMRSVRLEVLSWIRMVTKCLHSIIVWARHQVSEELILDSKTKTKRLHNVKLLVMRDDGH